MRSAMRAASQLPERGPLMWMMTLHLHVNQKSDYDDDDGHSSEQIWLSKKKWHGCWRYKLTKTLIAC